MKKNYLLLAIGVMNSLYSLGMFFDSFIPDYIAGGGNKTYFFWFICSVLFTAYSYLLIKEEDIVKEEEK